MFGHNSNSDDQASAVQHGSDSPSTSVASNFEPETIAPSAPTSAPPVVDASAYQVTDLPPTAPVAPVADTAMDSGLPVDNSGFQPAAAPAPAVDQVSDTYAAAPSQIEAASPIAAVPAPSAPAPAGSLMELKQSALHELSPLLGHLDQSPEEKFRTTMMMIQAADDHTMLQTAYDAARAIQDEKVRAQALLDVVNEINYFTQQTDGSANVTAS